MERRGLGWKSLGGVLDEGLEVASFVREIKATQKMGASGLYMLCVVRVISSGWFQIAASYTRGRIQTINGRFSRTRRGKITKNERKKDSSAEPKKERHKPKRHKHPKRHSKGTSGATTATCSIAACTLSSRDGFSDL